MMMEKSTLSEQVLQRSFERKIDSTDGNQEKLCLQTK